MTERNFKRRQPQMLELIETARQNNASLIQIREKQLPAKLVFELAREAAKITGNTKTKLLINDRADIALAAQADGVHLTCRSLSANIIRRSFPENFLIGVSTHSIEEAENARQQAADFAVFSPIFPTPNKGEARGINQLRQICERLKPFPIVALGGIDAANYAEVLAAGASGFAAIRFLNNRENLKKLAANLRG